MPARPKSEQIRKFIIDHLDAHPSDISKLTAERFGISRQSVNRHISILIEDDLVEAEGGTRGRKYKLKTMSWDTTLKLLDHQDEDKVYRELVEPLLEGLKANVLGICHYGFTEMLNNVIDHSEGEYVTIFIERTARTTTLTIKDDGVGLFEKVKTATGLSDYGQVILELSKGKLTTDPDRHTGQGIFFTSRMFDRFLIFANSYFFRHFDNFEGWFTEQESYLGPGTKVFLTIDNESTRTSREVFDKFTDLESGDYEFSKTHVSLKLAQFGADGLISRSAAKRVLARFDQFSEVFLDFTGVDSIGHSFADEIFRVFPLHHPGIKIIDVGANEEVHRAIKRARRGARI